MIVTGTLTVAPVWLPTIISCVSVTVVTSFGTNVKLVPRTTTALLDTASPINVGVVADPANPVPVNIAASLSYRIAVYPNGEAFNPSDVVTVITWLGVEVALYVSSIDFGLT